MFSNIHIYIFYSLSLRELEAQLRAAYMNKERAAQLAEREAMKYDEMVKLQLTSLQHH